MVKSQIFPINTLFKPPVALTTWFIVDFILVIVLILSCNDSSCDNCLRA